MGSGRWPFDPPGRATVYEIYPRLFTGPLNKSDPAARRRLLEGYALPEAMIELAADTDDAFDAAVSALEMWRARAWFAASPRPAGAASVEGWIVDVT